MLLWVEAGIVEVLVRMSWAIYSCWTCTENVKLKKDYMAIMEISGVPEQIRYLQSGGWTRASSRRRPKQRVFPRLGTWRSAWEQPNAWHKILLAWRPMYIHHYFWFLKTIFMIKVPWESHGLARFYAHSQSYWAFSWFVPSRHLKPSEKIAVTLNGTTELSTTCEIASDPTFAACFTLALR